MKTPLASIRSAMHRCLRVFGVDVYRIGNLDAVIRQREEHRRREYLTHIAAAREASESRDPRHPRPQPRSLTWVEANDLLVNACRLIAPASVVLDVGCAFHPQSLVDATIHICCEPYRPYLDRLIVETSAAGKYVYLHGDLELACQTFPPRSVDSVFLIDVIEHLEREQVLDYLGRLQGIARSQIVVFTPLGFMPQEPPSGQDFWGMGGFDCQRHRSGWTPEDFRADGGWQVVACEEYHLEDAYGHQLAKPIGALWAVWTRSQKAPNGGSGYGVSASVPGPQGT